MTVHSTSLLCFPHLILSPFFYFFIQKADAKANTTTNAKTNATTNSRADARAYAGANAGANTTTYAKVSTDRGSCSFFLLPQFATYLFLREHS